MSERTITNWSTGALKEKLSGLSLCDGVTIGDVDGSWVTGEVSIGDRKGKSFPIYSLEAEVPFSGTVNGAQVAGTVRLPDVSLEMLDDLEVSIDVSQGDAATLGSEDASEAVRGAVRSWAASVRKAVAESLDTLPLDPPTQSRTPRAAALISEEESMSAAGAADLDDAEDIEELPHPDDEDGEPQGEEEDPFDDEEVKQLYDDAQQALREACQPDELEAQLQELEQELDGRDLQERGRILVEVLEYLRNPPEEGEEGAEGEAQDELGPYPGEEGLQQLYDEVKGMCVEEDVPRLEEELKGKPAEEQWRILGEVLGYLRGDGGEEGEEGEEGEMDEAEQREFDAWKPTPTQVDKEWKALMARVEPDEAAEVAADYQKAGPDDRKRMVWDVRKYLSEREAEGEEEDDPTQPAKYNQQAPKAPPPRPPTDAELGGRNEVRRRGGGANRGREYERSMECGFGDSGSREGGEWNDYYDKEMRGQKRKSSTTLILGAVTLGALLVLLLLATLMADEDESVMSSAMRLVGLGAAPEAKFEAPPVEEVSLDDVPPS